MGPKEVSLYGLGILGDALGDAVSFAGYVLKRNTDDIDDYKLIESDSKSGFIIAHIISSALSQMELQWEHLTKGKKDRILVAGRSAEASTDTQRKIYLRLEKDGYKSVSRHQGFIAAVMEFIGASDY